SRETGRRPSGMNGETIIARPPPGRKALPSIQILRALAAIGVAAFHVRYELTQRLGVGDQALPDLTGCAPGLDLCFAISGFIMVYASAALFGRPEAPGIFMRQRLTRIVPLYWAASGFLLAYTLSVGVDWGVANLSIGVIVASLLFLPYPRPDGTMVPLL